MPTKLPWVRRTFTFDFPVEIYPDILERFRGLPARVDEKIARCSPDMLTRREASGGWTIQENLGHLLDLEPLWDRRVEAFLAGAKILPAADITNQATNHARHNERPIGEIVSALRRAREEAVDRLEALSDADFARTSVHPRLKTPMRLVDAMQFACGHDDYHMARVSELMRVFRTA